MICLYNKGCTFILVRIRIFLFFSKQEYTIFFSIGLFIYGILLFSTQHNILFWLLPSEQSHTISSIPSSPLSSLLEPSKCTACLDTKSLSFQKEHSLYDFILHI